MKTIVAIAAFLISSAASASASAAVSLDKACWDGSFGYNYARAVTSERGIEVSIAGNSFELPRLYTTWGESLGFDSFSRPKLHIVLPNNAKQEGDTITASAIQSGGGLTPEGEFAPVVSPILWLEHSVRDLGQDLPVLTDIELQSVKLKITADGIELKIVQHFAPGEKRPVQTIDVPCAFDRAPDHVSLPERLAKHLDAK